MSDDVICCHGYSSACDVTECHVIFCDNVNPGKLFTHVAYLPLSPSSIIWYWPKGSDAVRLGRYRKSSNTSQALNTSRGSDLIVLIEAGPQIQAGFHKLAQLHVNLLSRLCIERNTRLLGLQIACHQFDVLIQAGPRIEAGPRLQVGV